jgi:hypothetical protein
MREKGLGTDTEYKNPGMSCITTHSFVPLGTDILKMPPKERGKMVLNKNSQLCDIDQMI